MKKKILLCCLLFLSGIMFPFSYAVKKASASTPVVYWEGMQLVKGQVGKVDILKPINLWKRENNKLKFVRVLKPGEAYRVYRYDAAFGGQYGVGGQYFVTNMKGYVQYKTPSKLKLKLVNPELYGTKLTLGTVTQEQTAVLAPGVTQSKLSVKGSKGNQEIYKLDVDQKSSQISFETSLAKDQMIGFETVNSMAHREEDEGKYVIAGVNGDYFDSNGAPTDLTVHNGELVTTNTTPVNERTIFGVSFSGKAMIGNPEILLSVSANGQKPYLINSVNKRRFAGHLVLYTSYFASNTMTNELGTEVVLSNVTGQLNGNGQVTATVKEVIIGKGSAALKPGEFILSGHAAGSDYLKSLKAGDSVTINASYDKPEWDRVQQAIGGRYHLVKGGNAKTFNIAGAHPRTAIGIKEDGSVFAVVIDGRRAQSKGVTLTDLAKVMKDFGAVEAITFDGGGSSTMVTRKQGETTTSVVNNPSDGRERNVSNSLLIIARRQAGELHRLLLNPEEVTLFAGASYKDLKIAAKGVDKNNNTVSLKDPIVWTSNVGKFNSDGSFTASGIPGKGTITGTSGTVAGSVSVHITNVLDSIKVPKDTIIVDKNGTAAIPASGYHGGMDVVRDPAAFTYSVSDNLGTVENGIFKASGKDGIGKITISHGKVSAEIKVITGNPGPVIIEDFEGDISGWQVSGARYESVKVSPESVYVKEGKRSLKVAYNFIGTTGTSGVYASKKEPIPVMGAPKKIGMWVYGDNKGHWLRSQLKDAAGKEIQLDFTKNLDWTGWKYVEADIPAGLTAPYVLEIPVRYMQVSDEHKNRGQIFIDQIQAVYE
ncbi:phosphodiester glycosidase family protein [Cytobacillus oceanisediminis]|uniref:Phosphodiester glycosidase domain-containing protein n=1 Tax=Cytobacillus oceanisediminis TaxID=665099 RepID=A0ABX3CK42_9BACI|nr:phosphodiester glycosidase family protein [Cytobacillus oceanisediminis]MCM3403657.1 phosphodiester glycosidase family protein [Cytobacillus oceanisediminis]MDK7666837.1 phosphodiester glycosidase family protein [Cytobacillus oceanisediminis]OHX41536.1 hypothetical protein BBV17_28275 [Cytobacillus oceanisediminis]